MASFSPKLSNEGKGKSFFYVRYRSPRRDARRPCCGWNETPRAIWAVSELKKASQKPINGVRTRDSQRAYKAASSNMDYGCVRFKAGGTSWSAGHAAVTPLPSPTHADKRRLRRRRQRQRRAGAFDAVIDGDVKYRMFFLDREPGRFGAFDGLI